MIRSTDEDLESAEAVARYDDAIVDGRVLKRLVTDVRSASGLVEVVRSAAVLELRTVLQRPTWASWEAIRDGTYLARDHVEASAWLARVSPACMPMAYIIIVRAGRRVERLIARESTLAHFREHVSQQVTELLGGAGWPG